MEEGIRQTWAQGLQRLIQGISATRLKFVLLEFENYWGTMSTRSAKLAYLADSTAGGLYISSANAFLGALLYGDFEFITTRWAVPGMHRNLIESVSFTEEIETMGKKFTCYVDNQASKTAAEAERLQVEVRELAKGAALIWNIHAVSSLRDPNDDARRRRGVGLSRNN